MSVHGGITLPRSGPIFRTRTARAMSRRQGGMVLDHLDHLVDQANAHLPDGMKMEVSPHASRHACLRRVAREVGETFALEQSGHHSQLHISRYIQPSEDEMRDRLSPPGDAD